MQKLKNMLMKSLPGLILLIASATSLYAQKLDKAEVQKAVQSKHFVFKAQTMLPMTGGSKQLTTDYDVRISGDSIVSYLPYFGRAYSASFDTKGPLDFTSSKFEYKVKPAKKGGWNITIEPKDTRDVHEMNFSISENGYANLQVTSNNRQPISFYGYITVKK